MFFSLTCPSCSERVHVNIMKAADGGNAQCQKCGTSINPITGEAVVDLRPPAVGQEENSNSLDGSVFGRNVGALGASSTLKASGQKAINKA